ncbi:hypothetical protein CEXT_673371 [Caerostris extrusa]|uniref:Uncharacterized protein n=1 Tax=Caerostris extrusa TaxID=172846 RepID=A0AAV4XJZ8_CAEEX|nr:hypothetical protein CEXT_673371 [Caerostris extrusa]
MKPRLFKTPHHFPWKVHSVSCIKLFFNGLLSPLSAAHCWKGDSEREKKSCVAKTNLAIIYPLRISLSEEVCQDAEHNCGESRRYKSHLACAELRMCLFYISAECIRKDWGINQGSLGHLQGSFYYVREKK